MQRAERDLADLEQRLRTLALAEPTLADFFVGVPELVLARAPGRLDVMGGFADYSGALVLEMPVAEAACVAAGHSADDCVWVVSLGRTMRQARFPAAELWAACCSHQALRAYLMQHGEDAGWAAYLLGGLCALGERGVTLSGGLRLLVDSAVPEGKGVSSSAAIEVAALRALGELWQVAFSGLELGLACQAVENRVVGAPCGVMDQLTSACGEPGHLLALLCQPAELRGFVAPPPGVEFFGVDSGVRHAVVGADYRHVRVAAFMGLRILAERLGARVRDNGPGRVVLEDDPLNGYLANLSPVALTSAVLEALPERISGAEFVRRFAGISDDVTHIEPDSFYMVRAATRHPIEEHARVQEFVQKLPGATETELTHLGGLMLAAHASYSACGVGSDGTDALVRALSGLGPANGIFGAKISGGGSGGTVAVMARSSALPQVERVAAAYVAQTGRASHVFSGSSPGAALVPPHRVRLPFEPLPIR